MTRPDRRTELRAAELAWLLLLVALVGAIVLAPRPADADEPTPVATVAATAFRTLGPLEAVVPVPVPATPAPSPSETARSALPAPTGADGTVPRWPDLLRGQEGIASTYGPGYDGWLALPWPWCGGWRVEIVGPGGRAERVSNDCGPERRLLRVADLDVATFERVCGVPWRMGLCNVTVTVVGRVR